MTFNLNTAPYPQELAELVSQLEYKPGWNFQLLEMDRGQGCSGLTLVITTRTYNSYHPEEGENYRVQHLWPVPPAAFDRQSWQRWLLDQIIKVETHEACEFFQLVYVGDFTQRDGSQTTEYRQRPYAPNHGPGRDPYVIFELATVEHQRTSYRGVLKED